MSDSVVVASASRVSLDYVQHGTVAPGTRLHLISGSFNRFDVLIGKVLVPALLWLSPSYSDRLLIATNGAVARRKEKIPGEVFQRSSWVDELNASVLYIADPTLNEKNTISIGWGQGVDTDYAIPAMAQCAQYVAAMVNVESTSRLYFGSSAGGFQAMQLAGRDDQSSVLVNNPQYDWTLYREPNVRAVCRYAYGGMAPEDVVHEFPDRTSVIAFFLENGYVPRARILVNTASQDDFEIQLPVLTAGIETLAPLSTSPRVDVSFYFDSRTGHNPLPKRATVAELNRHLSRLV